MARSVGTGARHFFCFPVERVGAELFLLSFPRKWSVVEFSRQVRKKRHLSKTICF